MEQYIKNNRELKNKLMKKVKYLDNYSLKVVNYTSWDEDMVITDLEVNVYRLGEYVDCVSCYSLESKDVDGIVESHRKELEPLKKKIFKYLKLHFSNVELGEDYCQ